jgi:hypothetical protein
MFFNIRVKRLSVYNNCWTQEYTLLDDQLTITGGDENNLTLLGGTFKKQ